MAYICDSCHRKGTGKPASILDGGIHFSGSYGPCELCRKVGPCADCRCQFRAGWNDEPSKETPEAVATTAGGRDKESPI